MPSFEENSYDDDDDDGAVDVELVETYGESGMISPKERCGGPDPRRTTCFLSDFLMKFIIIGGDALFDYSSAPIPP
jgi:hypothetical protein